MHYLILITLFLANSLLVFSQVYSPEFEEYNNFLLRSHKVHHILEYTEIEGSPFTQEGFLPGHIDFVSGNKVDSLPMRYNWYSRKMEMKPEDEILEMPESELIRYIILGNEKYVPFFHVPSVKGYMIELHRGNCSLFLKKEVIFQEAEPTKSGYDEPKPPRFQWKRPVYMLISDKGDILPLDLNKKRFPMQFPKYEDQLNALIKSQKLNPKDENDLIKLVEAMDGWIAGR